MSDAEVLSLSAEPSMPSKPGFPPADQQPAVAAHSALAPATPVKNISTNAGQFDIVPSTAADCTDVQDLKEFTKKAADLHGVSSAAAMRCHEIFLEADTNKTGTVNVRAVHGLLEDVCGTSIRPHELEDILAAVGFARDGEITYEEFVQAFSKTPHVRVARLEKEIDEMAKESRQQMADHRLTPEERVTSGPGVPGSYVKRYLRKELREANACLSLPQAMATFCIFLLAVMLHLKVEKLHAVDRSISFDINENANFAFAGAFPFDTGRMGHKSFADVNSIANFWSWFNMGLVPLFWAEGWELSEVRDNAAWRCQSPAAAFESFGWNSTFVQDTVWKRRSAIAPKGMTQLRRPVHFSVILLRPHTSISTAWSGASVCSKS
jgi:hypothetical protein